MRSTRTPSPEALFVNLSEEWIRASTVSHAHGFNVPANVSIRLKKDYSVIDAHIEGPGGQKDPQKNCSRIHRPASMFSI